MSTVASSSAAPEPSSLWPLRVVLGLLGMVLGGMSLAACVITVPPTSPTDQGAFRVRCDFSHASKDDPLAEPGRPGAAHQHLFYGNESTNAFSTTNSLMAASASTCHGGTLNRSAYWVPAMYDANNKPMIPETMHGYYKTGVLAPGSIQNIPEGLGIIAGNAMTQGNQDDQIARWFCTPHVNETDDLPTSPTIPQCRNGWFVEGHVIFPQCWDGQRLTASDQSHMAYPKGGRCPASHPNPLPRVGMKFLWRVGPAGTSGWRLSSDHGNQRPGQSLHADWMNGWDTATMNTFVSNCLRGALDCQGGVLGDGRTLSRQQFGKGALGPDLPGWEAHEIGGTPPGAKPIGVSHVGFEKLGSVNVSGWALDPNTFRRTTVAISVDGQTKWRGKTTKLHSQVHPAYNLHGRRRAFSQNIYVPPGTHNVCVRALESGTQRSRGIGCKTITVDGDPIGSFNQPGNRGGSIFVKGWAVEPEPGTTKVRIIVDGVAKTTVNADEFHQGTGNRFPRQGPNHGFSATIPVSSGSHTVCVKALNRGVGNNTDLGCKNVTT